MNRQDRVRRHNELSEELRVSAGALEALRRHLGCSAVSDTWIQSEIEKWQTRHRRAYEEIQALSVWKKY